MMKRVLVLVFAVGAIAFNGCVQAPTDQGNGPEAGGSGGKIKIGFSMATLKEERWTKDKEAFEAHCRKMEVECVVTVANANANKQANDVDNLLTQGVDVLVIAPHDSTQAASMVNKAKAQNVPVISYDRLINNDKIDLYISHQVPVIGRKMAEYALERVPKGNYVLVYGASTDNNGMIMKKEQNAVLKAAVDRGDIKIVADQHAKDWKPDEALKIVENALTQNNDKIDVVIASNDGTAGGAISALETKGLAGKVLVTGQDAEKAALQRIAEGKQTMTVYKPITPLANGAVEAAIKLAKKEKLDSEEFKSDGIEKPIRAILLEVIVVDKDNLMDTVIKDGWISFDDVYLNVPEDKRPKKPE
ncbi:MAG: substrate-binding domain-containing protein [Acidobacteriota bacterium]|nr:substrate-binding domain-containing protein [Acidobacteriota bacterium]MDH3529809.1 substrate-binding domain-containing protein [Acidobacteriota bacterium]